jgi:hypothetical protein
MERAHVLIETKELVMMLAQLGWRSDQAPTKKARTNRRPTAIGIGIVQARNNKIISKTIYTPPTLRQH